MDKVKLIAQRMKEEISEDIACGGVPGNIADFTDLQGHTDANMLADELQTKFIPEGEWAEWIVPAQELVDVWLKDGRPCDYPCLCHPERHTA